jgi:phosphatidylglycerophosphatase A
LSTPAKDRSFPQLTSGATQTIAKTRRLIDNRRPMSDESTLREPSTATKSAPNGASRPAEANPTPSFEDRVAERIASWFGCGNFKNAPGTVGSLGAVPLHWLLSRMAPLPHAVAVAFVAGAGIWAAGRRAEQLGEKDPQSIVIDEVAGTLIALGLVRRKSLAVQLATLVLFRVFDITKPGIIDRAQHAKPVGLGIMADDLLAGALAGVLGRWLGRKS